MTVRVGSTAPISAGNPWQGRENGRSNRISKAWHYHAPVLSLQRGHRRRQAGAPVAAQPKARMAGAAVGELDVAGLGWTSWDMIQKVLRADQGHSGATDATRTGCGFHAAGNGVSAGQRLFRWAGMGSL